MAMRSITKMAKKLYTESKIQNIAAAIRAKNGSSTIYSVNEMPAAIQALPDLPKLPVGIQFRNSTSDLYNFLSGVDLTSTTSRTDFSYIFSNCSGLTTVPLFDTSNGTTMASMFLNCASLTSVPLFDTSKVTDMSNMFYGCTSLTSVPKFNTSKVTICNYMFKGCTALTSVPLFDTSKVTDPGAMFNGCSHLVDLPQFDFSKVTSFGIALSSYKTFYGCTALSNDSLNNILGSMAGATAYSGTKTLNFLGLTSAQATICEGLSNYSAFTAAGWSKGD